MSSTIIYGVFPPGEKKMTKDLRNVEEGSRLETCISCKRPQLATEIERNAQNNIKSFIFIYFFFNIFFNFFPYIYFSKCGIVLLDRSKIFGYQPEEITVYTTMSQTPGLTTTQTVDANLVAAFNEIRYGSGTNEELKTKEEDQRYP